MIDLNGCSHFFFNIAKQILQSQKFFSFAFFVF